MSDPTDPKGTPEPADDNESTLNEPAETSGLPADLPTNAAATADRSSGDPALTGDQPVASGHPGGGPAPFEPDLGVGHLFRSGWRILRARPALLLFTAALLALVNYIGSLVVARFLLQAARTVAPGNAPFSGPVMLTFLLFGLLQIMLTMGQCVMILRIRRGAGRFADIFAPFAKTPKILVVLLLTSLLGAAGFLLLVVPGVVLTLGLLFAPLIAFESDLGLFASLKGSWRLTKGYKVKLFLYAVIQIVVAIPLLGAFQFLLTSAVAANPALANVSAPEYFILLNTFNFVFSLIIIPLELVFIGGWLVAYDELLTRYRKDDGQTAAEPEIAPGAEN